MSTASIAGDTMKGLFDHNQAHMCNLQDCFEFLLKYTLGHGSSYHQCSLGHVEPEWRVNNFGNSQGIVWRSHASSSI